MRTYTRLDTCGEPARRRFLPAMAALLVLAAACGQQFSLPPEPDPEPIPDAGRYSFDRTWSLPAPRDLKIWGSYIYVITANTGADSAEVKARVEMFLTSRPDPVVPPSDRIQPFTGLIDPVHLAVAHRESIYVFVADRGDMKVKRFNYTGGPPRFSFTDPTWREFSGLAADDDLNVYIADAARDTIARYDDHGRFSRVISSWGAGSGFVMRPHGMEWNGRELVVSDTDQDRIVLLRTDATETASGSPVGVGAGPFRPMQPLDVAADRLAPHLYVTDTGNSRILKFDLDGTFVDSVYSARDSDPRMGPPLLEPAHVTVRGRTVFVSDAANNRLVAFQLADSLQTGGK